LSFLFSDHSLTFLDWMLRATVGFVFMLFSVKILGQRTISQMRLLDFVVVLIVGNIIAHPLSDEQLSLTDSFISIGVLVILYLICNYLTFRSNQFKHFVNPHPLHLISNGKIQYQNLKKARITIDELLSELRKEKIDDPKKVALACWEAGGFISTFLYPKYEHPTREDLQIKEKPFHFNQPIIKDGTIEQEVLTKMNKDSSWLLAELKHTYHVQINEILLATLNENDKIDIYLYK